MRSIQLFVALAALAAPIAPALAQDSQPDTQPKTDRPAGDRPDGQRNQRGPGGPGGPGMFGGPQLAPEALKAAWEAQAKGVATSLALDATKTAAMTTAYTSARESYNRATEAAIKKMRDDAGGEEPGREAFTAMRESMDKLNRTERGKLERALNDALAPEEAKKALESLGTFSRQWDGMVDAVLGFKLDDAKQADALKAIQAYIVASGKARNAGPNADRDAMRMAMMEARDTLSASLKPLLTADQMTKFESTMGRGGGNGPRPGRGDNS